MTILFTNIGLTHRTGTEMVVADLARALQALGHRPMVYSPRLGEVAEEIAAGGIPVVDDVARLPAPPDVIHGHHHLETVQAIQHFPGTPALFVCHDSIAWHDAPPRHPNILRFVAVDENCRERLLRDWPPIKDRVEVIHNWVDLTRFRPRTALPASPRRALVFSNNAGNDSHRDPIAEACARLGIALDIVGAAAGRQVREPETILPEYDLVFAKGRCAMEAMAVGSAVVVCDTEGLGGMITSANVSEWRRWNFGRRLLTGALDAGLIVKEIEKYDAHDAAHVSEVVRDQADLNAAVDRYLGLYRRIEQERIPLGMWYQFPSAYPPTGRIEARDQAGLTLEVEDTPIKVQRGRFFKLSVKVKNKSGVTIASSPPWPVLLVHRWNKTSGVDGRHLVQPPLWPGSQRAYPMLIAAPPRPGEYRLSVTLLQEGWRRLDQVDPPVLAECTIRVAPARGDGV